MKMRHAGGDESASTMSLEGIPPTTADSYHVGPEGRRTGGRAKRTMRQTAKRERQAGGWRLWMCCEPQPSVG